MGQAVGTKALQSLGQGGQVAAGIIPRGGKRGQCQNQQKNQGIPHPVPFAGRLCRSVSTSAGTALPYFCQLVPAACGRPDAARRIMSSSQRAGASVFATVRTQQPLRLPRNSTVSSARSTHPAARSAPTKRCAACTRASFAGMGPPFQSRTPFLHPAPFPAGLPAECLRPHHSIPAACGAFPAPAPLHEQGSSPLLHRALPQSGRSGPCGPFPARQAFRPAGPQAPLPHGHGIGLQCLPAVLPVAPSTAVRQTDAAHRWSAFFLRVSTASPPRPGAARINP